MRRPAHAPGRVHAGPWRDRVRHLRLHFEVLLSPLFLYGALLAARAEGAPAAGTLLAAWLSLHVFLYGGATAFNSFYDRDEGPVGGMLRPPPVDPGLLPFSLAVQAAGLPLALAVGPAFAAAWLALAALFAAYSHPTVRLKASPAAALATIALGQGALGVALGWLAVAPPAGLVRPHALAALATAALAVSGLYLVTQCYQTAEDRARGDRTLPVLLGPARSLRLAVALLGAGGALLVGDLHRLAGAAVSAPLALLFAAIGAYAWRWAARFREAEVGANYRRAMTVVAAAGVGTGLALLACLTALGVADASRAGLPLL